MPQPHTHHRPNRRPAWPVAVAFLFFCALTLAPGAWAAPPWADDGFGYDDPAFAVPGVDISVRGVDSPSNTLCQLILLPGAFGPTWADDGAGFGGLDDPAFAVLGVDSPSVLASQPETVLEPGVVYQVPHTVALGDGRFLRIDEYFTLESWQRRPRRGVLFLNGSAFNRNHWPIPYPGYDATRIVGERGFFAYTVDFLGVGDSFLPADGRDASFAANVEALETALRYLRWRRQIPQLDLVSEGYGAAMATQLAADPGRVSSVVMASALYRDLRLSPINDPVFRDMLENSPDGYVFIPSFVQRVFLTEAPEPVADYVATSQEGRYPAPGFEVALELPFYDPGVARVPGLVIYGPLDEVVGPTDAFDLADAYGRRGAEIVVLDGAGHAPRVESPEIAAAYWQAVLDFIDP